MKTIVIGIAGGTGSGKSTFTNRLKAAFPEEIAVLYHDNYYKSRDSIPFEERMKINYDHPDALETNLLVEHIKSLKDGKIIQCLVYDYTQHNRSKETILVKPSRIVIVEGILSLHDIDLRQLFDIKIFVEADADERILRRVLRDTEERGRDLRGIISQYINTVKPMHYLYVEPTKAIADIIINSGMNDVAFDMVETKIRMLLQEA